MFDPNFFANPTPLAHVHTSRDVLPSGGTSQWRPTRFNLYDPEMRNAIGFNVWPKVYFSGSENVTEILEGRGWNERRMSNVGNNRGNWTNSKVVRRPNNGRNDYRGNYQNSRQGNQWFDVKMTILVEGTKEVGVRVKILAEVVENKWDD
ncbi:uncharacterized protein TNCV_1656971 [Trichonephila clavipes]|nr:uncharacterized protein TNCV_1656971 [Trichonephila clavipes]